jgi:hypothetical protein
VRAIRCAKFSERLMAGRADDILRHDAKQTFGGVVPGDDPVMIVDRKRWLGNVQDIEYELVLALRSGATHCATLFRQQIVESPHGSRETDSIAYRQVAYASTASYTRTYQDRRITRELQDSMKTTTDEIVRQNIGVSLFVSYEQTIAQLHT